MRKMLSYLLLISIPALISSDFIITESEHHKNDYANSLPSVSKLARRTLEKRSPAEDGKKSQRDLEIYGMKIESKVTSRFAHNVVNSRVANQASESKEAFFEMELPKTAFITNFSMTLDGVTYVGAVKEKEVAQEQYQQAVSQGQTAGIVKTSGRKLEMFTVSVNIGPTKKVTFELTYEELLKRNLGKYEMNIRVKPQQLVKNFQIDVHIFEPQGIAFLNVDAKFLNNNLTSIVKNTLTATRGHISFNPTLEQQRKCPNCDETILDGDFIIKYDVNRVMSAGNVQIVNGYFVHHFAPTDLSRIPKNVIFVIDHSGSMSGAKMRQTKEALVKMLDDMDPMDSFAVIIFDDSFKTWQNAIFQATEGNVTKAKTFVNTIIASGGTNINDPMLEAVNRLNKAHKEKVLPERSVSMIILLTDGDPNTGELNPTEIQKNVKKAANGRYNVYCLGFGYDVKYSFLEKMALENNGIARRIYEDSDAPLQLQGFYDEVANPLLLDIELHYPENFISELTQINFRQIYNGSEIVVAGKIIDNSIDSLTARVHAQTANENLILQTDVKVSEAENTTQQQQYIFGDFTERLWAYLTIQQLLEKRISAETNEKKNVTNRILELSLKYNFVTPLTSMVVTKPEENNNDTFVANKPSEDEMVSLPPRSPRPSTPFDKNLRRGYASGLGYGNIDPPEHLRHLRAFFPSRGRGSFLFFNPGIPITSDAVTAHKPVFTTVNHPDSDQGIAITPDDVTVDSDPQIIISINNHSDAICLNIDGKPNAILNLVTDPHTGLAVNGLLTGQQATATNQNINTPFRKLGIVSKKTGVKVEVSRQKIVVFHGEEMHTFPWLATASLTNESFSISIVKNRNLTLTMDDAATFVILRHQEKNHHPTHRHTLGFYTRDSHGLSNMTHGLLGQFYHEINTEEQLGTPDTIMTVQGHKLTVTRGYQKDYRFDSTHGTNIQCWVVHYSRKGVFDGIPTDYVVSSLFDSLPA